MGALTDGRVPSGGMLQSENSPEVLQLMVEGGAVLQGQLLQRNLVQAHNFWVLYRMLSGICKFSRRWTGFFRYVQLIPSRSSASTSGLRCRGLSCNALACPCSLLCLLLLGASCCEARLHRSALGTDPSDLHHQGGAVFLHVKEQLNNGCDADCRRRCPLSGTFLDIERPAPSGHWARLSWRRHGRDP